MSKNCSDTSQKSRFQTIDLFSGCGGFSLGFQQAGLYISAGIDMNEQAATTASYNLHWKNGENKTHISGDVATHTKEDLLPELDLSNPFLVIGGPPCQAYSSIGKGKLKSLGEERAHTNDSRGMLYEAFINKVLEFNAELAVMENVVESVNYGGVNIPETVCRILEKSGYSARWTILNAADFGVPQLRERVFVTASRKYNVTKDILPFPTHQPPEGTLSRGSRRIKKFMENDYFLEPNSVENSKLPYWITAGEAISDMPTLKKSSADKYEFYPMNLNFPYSSEAQNEYQKLMRRKAQQNVVNGHAFRKTTRDFPIFERMKEGDNYLDAHAIAVNLFNDYCSAFGIDELRDKELYKKEKRKKVPPYSTLKFKDKWKKIDSTKPCHTLVAHLSTDTYSHIHPWEARGISVREAARMQSFPDDFFFQCGMSEAFKQIGNAVPPLLAKSLAESILTWYEKVNSENFNHNKKEAEQVK
ncbi:DNA cytosine methyltransferase [Alkalicoccus daliensis]|uniref:DNA (cytosine-5-)-methyltransferase n=1 Tax=Alkalicoccus daliensis TaxID=745820 RepID=A0A1H0E9Z5_9BACI|nr:DNA cytosine methyltransferase [Alkalicoccus daliensis]SDN79116.1 DNA (cytosine-5)-methyltransferase 1 [Alkalicoccus daliensis]